MAAQGAFVGRMGLLAGLILAFSFSSAAPASASPSQYFTTNRAFSPCIVGAQGGQYPPESSPSIGTTASCGPAPSAFGDAPLTLSRSYNAGAGTYEVTNLLITWDTSSVPVGATVTNAWLEMAASATRTDDNLGISGDWYTHPSPSTCLGCIDFGDYSSGHLTGAVDAPLGNMQLGGDITSSRSEFELSSPDLYINKTGYTGLRLSVEGGQPTGLNYVTFATNSTIDLQLEYRFTGAVTSAVSGQDYLHPAIRSPGMFPFSRFSTVQYADRYAINPRLDTPWEPFPGTDCTNFVSQAWAFGGPLALTQDWYDESNPSWAWLFLGDRYFSASWVRVRAFADYMVNHRRVATFEQASLRNPYNPAWPGDAIMYDWGQGAGWSHLALEQSFDQNGDYVDQHTNNRMHSPWNLGYLNQRNPQTRLKMKALVIHLNTP